MRPAVRAPVRAAPPEARRTWRIAPPAAAIASVLALGILPAAVVMEAEAKRIPQWARQYGVTCAQCHVQVPRLNAFGGAFLARGYKMPPDSNFPSHLTIPLAIWASARSDSRPPAAPSNEHVRAYFNRLEIISGGKLVVPWMSYFVEWRAISQEARGDGTLRDRSGRFEDAFVTGYAGNFSFTLGQFRQMDQVDVSRRLGINEPLALSASLAGGGSNPREASIRAFSPAGRSPSVRAAWQHPFQDWSWTTSLALPVPGEFSIPLNDEARVEASNEIELRRKGVFAESYIRRGPTTLGVHAFYDNSDRYLVNAVTTGGAGKFYWTGVAGAARTGDLLAGRWSAEGEYVPHRIIGVGARVEDRAADGAELAFLPYLNMSFPSLTRTLRLTVERRFQKGRNGTFVELGAIF